MTNKRNMITLLTHLIPLNILPFVFLLVAFLFHKLCINVMENRKKKELFYTLDKNNKDFISFQKYFDKYYVTNIWYTFSMVILYIMSIFGIFLLIRLLFIGYVLDIIFIYMFYGIDLIL